MKTKSPRRRRWWAILGAESIDFLDIVFRLEKAFDIKIPRGELFPEDILDQRPIRTKRQSHARGHRTTEKADAVCRPDAICGKPGGTRFRQFAHGTGHVPIRGKQGGRGKLRLTPPLRELDDALVLDRSIH